MPKLFVYILGLGPLAFTQGWLRSSMGDWIAFCIVIVYLAALRLVAEKHGKK